MGICVSGLQGCFGHCFLSFPSSSSSSSKPTVAAVPTSEYNSQLQLPTPTPTPNSQLPTLNSSVLRLLHSLTPPSMPCCMHQHISIHQVHNVHTTRSPYSNCTVRGLDHAICPPRLPPSREAGWYPVSGTTLYP